MAENEFQTITNHDFGYTIEVPANWRDVGPDIYNSAFEVARYLRNSPRIHDGIVNIFWDIPGESPMATAESGDPEIFDLSRKGLLLEGITNISIEETRIGTREAARLDHAYKLGDIENWASRSYFMLVRNKMICLSMGTSDVDTDRELFDRIAGSFEAIEDAAGIVLVRDDDTPAAFITEVLETMFNYQHRRAVQRVVRMNAQRESVVALVERSEAEGIVELVNAQSSSAGHALIGRVAGEV